MSGSWDRPPSGDRDDSWPSEDLSASSSDRPEADRWSGDDSWSRQPSDEGSSWGAWPPPAPLPEDDLPDDADLPVSDPWAESWGDDALDAGLPSAPAAPQVPEAVGPERAPGSTPRDTFTPDVAGADPYAADRRPLTPDAAPWTPYEPGRAEPWMPADDPWSSDIDSQMPAAPEWTPDEPAGRPGPTAAAVADVTPERQSIFVDEPSQPEPQPEPEPEPQPEPEPEPAPEPEAQPQAEADPEPRAEPEPVWRSEPAWPERGESTQVLPSTWTPTEPATPAASERGPELDPVVGRIRVSLAQQADMDEEAEDAPSTAEQAVPWLIGVILLLAGMVIVLLALIFAGDASLAGGGGAVPSGSALAAVPSAGASESAAPSATTEPTTAPSRSTAPTPEPEPTLPPVPEYGALEMVYQGRSTARAPIYLLHHDFTQDEEAGVLAQDPSLDVRRFAWSRDGTVGAGLLADVLVSVEPGEEKRRLADGISTITFGDDSATVYAVRVTQDGADDVATVLAVDFASGDATEVASVSYARPTIGEEDGLAEAQFADEGGAERLYWVEGGTLRYWALGAGTWEIDPADGTVTELAEDARPTLWAPDADQRIRTAFEDGSSTITLLDDTDQEVISVSIEGRVSHLRWAPDGERVVFTVGRSAAGGGVLQDLFLWDLNEEDPMQLTATGAAFGAEWLGAKALWRE